MMSSLQRNPVSGLIVLLVVGLFAGGAGSASAQLTDRLERAGQLEDQREFARARKLYREYFLDHRTSADATRGWLRTSIRTRQWDEGKRSLNRLEKIQPNSASTAELGSTLFFRQEAYDTALRWAERYRERANESWRPFHYLAQIHLRKGQALTASKMVESAQLRTADNEWVLLDELLVEVNREQILDALKTAEKLRELSSDPTIYWVLTRTLSDQYSREELARFLDDGAGNLPPSDPPIIPPVDVSEYRYWWSRMTYRLGDRDAARNALGEPEKTFRKQWLRARLRDNLDRRKEAQQDVLDQWPDRLIAQWQQSRAVKSTEPLRSSRRREGAMFFYREFTDNRYLNSREAALSTIMRSLELYPLDEERQFKLAKYYRERGWEKKERIAAERSRTLGFSPPSRLDDYIEGLGRPDTDMTPSIPQATIGVSVATESPWEGPLEGDIVLQSIFRQNLYHQPAFVGYRGDIEDEDQLSSMVKGDTLDGGISITIREWGDELDASVDLLLPGDRLISHDFFDADGMEEWDLLNFVIRDLKDNWPWRGVAYEVTQKGAWVNLGRIHGLVEGDVFVFDSREPSYPEEPSVGEIHEDRLRLSFPSPYFKTVVPRGTAVEISHQ